MSAEYFISILAYAINPIIVSYFILPQVQELKKIKDGIVKFHITPIKPGLSSAESAPLKEAREKEIIELQSTIDTYELRFLELKSLFYVLAVSIVISVISFVLLKILPETILQFKSISISSVELISLLNTIIQFIILLVAVLVYAIKPSYLRDVSYLVKKMLINPFNLVDALGLSLSLGSANEVKSRLDPLTLYLSTRICLYGYRFLCIVQGEDKEKVFFVSLGPISTKSKISRLFLPPYWDDRGERTSIELGSFAFNDLEPQRLDIRIYFFIPFFRKDKTSAHLIHQTFDVKPGSEYVTGWGGGGSLNFSHTDDELIISGTGLSLKDFTYSGSDKVLAKVLDKYKKEIINSKKIIAHSDKDGNLVGSKKKSKKS